MNYVVKRIIKCNIGTYFMDLTFNDINCAFTWCEVYNTTCCAYKCGCQFQVEETSLMAPSLVFTQPPITTTTTYTPSYTYTLPYTSYTYTNSPLWYNSTTTATGTAFTFTIT